MINWLESLPDVVAGIVVVGGFLTVALAIGYVASKFTSIEVRTAHNDRAGFIIAVIGVIYAVLLAFVAIGVWDRYQQAETRSYEEAGAIATVYRDADSFTEAPRLRGTLRAYVRSVIEVEWPRMRRGQRSEFASALLEDADRQVRALPATSPRLANVQAQMLEAIDTALGDREMRVTVYNVGINGIIWLVLIVGAVVTISFTYLFGFDRTVMQQLMIGALTLVIALDLYLIVALDYPFRGGISVQPDAFRVLLGTFGGS
jgi:hypothetical protein